MADRNAHLSLVEPPSPWGPSLHLLRELVRGLGAELLEELVSTLEQRHDLSARLREIVARVPPREFQQNKYMSVEEYARHARVSARTIRSHAAAGMVEGEHFHREGRTGRRLIIHVEATDSWRASRRFAKKEEHALHDLATTEILRRRAHAALKKTGAR